MFRYRAVLIFKNLKDDDIQYLPPHDAVGTQELKTKLIECFNGDWKDPAWRDIIFTGQLPCSYCIDQYLLLINNCSC